MRTRPRLLPSLLGIVAAYFLSKGIYEMLLIGSCSTPAGPGEVPCPPGIEKHFFSVFGGILGGMATIFLGGSWFSFCAMFAGIAMAGIRAGMLPVEQGGQKWFIGFGLSFLIGPVIMLISMPLAGLKKLRTQRIMENGIPGMGTLLEASDTGVYINGSPRLKMRFRLEPQDGMSAPYEAEKTATVSRFATPRVGDRYPVWIDRDDPTKFVIAVGQTPPDSANTAGSPTSLRQIVNLAKQGARPTIYEPPNASVVSELGKLNELRLAGAISAEEFATRTAKLIDGGTA